MNIRRNTTFQVGRLIVVGTAALALVVGCGAGNQAPPDTYALSGTVLDEGGDPIPGVEVSFAGADTPAAVATDVDGSWEKSGLWGDVTVTVGDPAYTFASGTRTISAAAADVNFAGTMKTCNAGDRANPLDPCIITRIKQVQKIQEKLDGHYALGGDVDASATESWSGGAGFEPIGSQATNLFIGSLDGRGYEILRLFIDRRSTDEIGLFGFIDSGGEVRNLGLVDGNVHGHDYVGGLAGVSRGTISSSHNSGSVTGNERVGGLVGSNYATVEDSYNDVNGTVSGRAQVGGVAGRNSSGSIQDSHNAGAVTGAPGGSSIGGVAGANYHGTIERSHNSGRIEGAGSSGGIVGSNEQSGAIVATSYNTGSVVGTGNVGGVAGSNYLGTIEDSYNLGSVTSTARAGGVAGLLQGASSTVQRTFSAGVVQGATGVGGVAGLHSAGSLTDSYFDEEVSPGMGDEATYGRSTADMMQQSTYVPAWNFGTVWAIDDGHGYPDLIDNGR